VGGVGRLPAFFAYSSILKKEAMAGQPGLDFLQCNTFPHEYRRALGAIEPPIQRTPVALSPVVKRPECESDHSPSSRAEGKEVRAVLPSGRGCQQPFVRSLGGEGGGVIDYTADVVTKIRSAAS
jgi:hypothetical protein